ncbi:hypothetical protein [Actinoalloteichus hymeniacidonis]|uniref:hypothetical protein n=1 Tax=Actinoalloteichus hymeniacidonis TaxID=340345 RepID=UPI0012F79D26|nr:hypothetical protein [Actinoalloteichus hymeniacidonis]MBB5910294.1 hypothetical protein [Actinoalloteichus hymeniacidonis]
MSDGSTYETSLGADQLDTTDGFESSLAERLEGTGLTPEQFDEIRQRPVESYTAAEVEAIRDVRDGVETPPGEVVQRVLTGEVAANYLQNNPVFIPDGSGGQRQIFDPTEAGGFTTRYRDVAELRSPADVIEGLRLDYTDGGYEDRNGRPPYLPDDASIPVLRFPLDQPDNLAIPYGGTTPEGMANMGGDTRQDPPFTGNGFPGSEQHATPEFILSPTELGEVAELWVVDRDGNESLLGAFDPDNGQWNTTPDGDAWLAANEASRTELLAERDAAAGADPATPRPDTTPDADPTSTPDHDADSSTDPDSSPDRDGDPGDPADSPADPRPLTTEQQAILDASTTTPAGRAFFPDEPETQRSAQTVAPDPDGRRTYDLHGDQQNVFIGDQTLDAAGFADIVRADPDWNGEAIRLLSCDTGGLPDGFAADLARELGVEVLAPTQMGWANADGSLFSSSGTQDADGNWTPADPPDGTWQAFQPDGTTTDFSDGPYLGDSAAEGGPDDARARANTRSTNQVPDYVPPVMDPNVPPVPVLLGPNQRFADAVPNPEPNTWYRVDLEFENAQGSLEIKTVGDYFVGERCADTGRPKLEYVTAAVPNESPGKSADAYFPPGGATGPALGAIDLLLDPEVVYNVADGHGNQRFRTDGEAEPPPAVTWDVPDAALPNEGSSDIPPGEASEDTRSAPSPPFTVVLTEEWNPQEGSFTSGWGARPEEDRPANAQITLNRPNGDGWHATIFTDDAGNISRILTWAGPHENLFNPELGNRETMHFHHEHTTASDVQPRTGAPIPNVVYGVVDPPKIGESPGDPRWLFHTDEKGNTAAASGAFDYDKSHRHARESAIQLAVGQVASKNEYSGVMEAAGGHIFGHAAAGISERVNYMAQWAAQNATFGQHFIPTSWGEMENHLKAIAGPDLRVDRFDFWADRNGRETPEAVHVRFQLTMGDPPVTSTHLRSFPNVPPTVP